MTMNKIFELRYEWQATQHKLEKELRTLDAEDAKTRAKKTRTLNKLITAKRELDKIGYQIQAMDFERKAKAAQRKHTRRYFTAGGTA